MTLFNDMGSKDGGSNWSVFDSVKFLPAAPEALMSEINVAIAALEYARSTALLNQYCVSPSRGKSPDQRVGPAYDAGIAEEAYKLACTALSEGKVDEGLHSLNCCLAKCPPDQTDAIAKIQSLISFAEQQLQVFSK